MKKTEILIIDDDKNFLDSIEYLLSDGGYASRLCQDSSQALLLIEEKQPDCVLLDMYMPALDGQDLLLLIKRKYPALPVLMCSGTSDVNETYLLKSGADKVLRKPFTHDSLFKEIDMVVSESDEEMPIVIKGYNLREVRDKVLRKVIIKALSKTQFNITQAATLMGISRQCLLRYIQRLKITY